MPSYYGIKIKTSDGVYAPAEDTLLLAGTLDARPNENVLDMGTGTGVLGLIAAKTAKHVLAVDINDAALKCAKENALLNGVKNMTTRKSDLFSNIPETFDLIIFNPPYLPTEEREPRDEVSFAWDGGRSGRGVIGRFLKEVKDHLTEGGRILIVGSSLSNYEKTIDFLTLMEFSVSILTSKKLDFEELVVIRVNYDS